MANGWAPFIGAIVVAVFMAAAWFLAPKGENQTYALPRCSSVPGLVTDAMDYRIWRSTLLLSAVSMYLMWCMYSPISIAFVEKREEGGIRRRRNRGGEGKERIGV